ncbi:PfkB family carbohydrate kinase, partial [Pseudorhodobacter sp.]|uniref:PfkB family carbohydrate kinase n=1 Tax=Pseudorhodobacter sp. TaxID=1934400 RepID=UPI0026475728
SLHNAERSFSYWRGQSAARQLAQAAGALQAAMLGADLVYFSGISLAILDAQGRKTLLDAAQTARKNGKTIAFDSNLRPHLWASNEEMKTNIMQAAAVSDIILPSYDDEAKYFCDTDIAATANRYLDAGAKTVIVKNGAGAVYTVHDGTVEEIATPPVMQIVDTTSAGDSFNAGFFASFDRPQTMRDRGLAASRVAAQVIGRKGALVPLKL